MTDEPKYHLTGVVKSRDETVEDFDGPLDVILLLLSKNKIEIEDISIAAILEHYAPSTENNTKAYIKAVVSHVQNAGFNGIGKLTELPAPSEDSRRLWVEIVIAIHNVECEHWPHDRQVIEDAFNYVFHLRK